MGRRGVLWCGLLVLCILAVFPSTATAQWTDLTPPSSVSGTLTASITPAGWPVPIIYIAGFRVPLHAGQSLVATLTTSSGVSGLDFRVSSDIGDYYIVAGPALNGVTSLPFAGETSQTAYLMIRSSTPGTFTLDLGDARPLDVSVGPLRAPGRAKRKRAFLVSTKLSNYDGFTPPVRFMIDRKVHGRWRGYSSALGNGDSPGESWNYYAKLRLPRGTFRVRARFRDSTHPIARYNWWKTVVVK